MTSQPLQLRRVRSLGEMLSLTMTFLQQNFRPIVALLTRIVLLPVAALSVIVAIGFSPTGRGGLFVATIILASVAMAFGVALLFACLNSFVALFEMNGGSAPTPSEVLAHVRQRVGPYVKTMLLVAVIMAGIALPMVVFPPLMLFCYPALIYLSVVYQPSTTIVAYEEISGTAALSRCFELVKGNFWPTLGLSIILSMISGMVFGSVYYIGIIAGAAIFMLEPGDLVIRLTLLIGIPIVLCSLVLSYLVTFIGGSLQYFNLYERLEGTSLMERIEQIGAEPALPGSDLE